MKETQIRVKGIAMRPGISKNGIKYTVEEIDKCAKSFIGRPILKDHDSRVDNTVGIVESCKSEQGIMDYEGWVKEDGTGLLEKVKDGRAKEVSIGAFAKQLVKENDNDDYSVAVGIEGMEISITPTPAVAGTSISQNLNSNVSEMEINEAISIFESYKNKSEEIKMSDDKLKEDTLRKEIEEKLRAEAEAKKIAEAQKIEEERKKESELRAKIEKEISEKIALEEAQKMKEDTLRKEIEEKAKKEKAEALRAKVIKDNIEAQETVEGKYVVEKSDVGKGMSFWQQPKADGSLI